MRFLISIFCAIVFCSLAKADIVIEISESGNDLLLTTSGSLNTIGLMNGFQNSNRFITLTSDRGFAFGVGAQESFSEDFVSPSGFTGVTVSSSGFTDGFFITDPILESGGADFAFTETILWIPSGYVGGTPVSQVLRVENVSFASAGFSPGGFLEMTWTGSVPGAGDTIRFAVSVPEPSSFAFFFSIASIGFGQRRRR